MLVRAGTPAEDAFARVRAAGMEHGATAPQPSRPAQVRPRRPHARLVPTMAPPLVEESVGPAHTPPDTVVARIAVLRASDRSLVTDTDTDDDRPRALPDGDPGVVARAVALASLEVLAGRRSVAQLARWLTPGIYESLQVRAGLTRRVLGAASDGTRPPTVRRARTCRVGAQVLEATVVADDGVRVRAVALRLEAHRGSWRVTALEIG
jgi:hypothetical protein